MLYLAEVIQKKGGLMGGSKAELKLLAFQRTEQNWTAVSGEEVIPADEVSRYSPGTLLLVDLTNSKQVQRIQEAGRPLVSILQNFSRLQEKFKTQEEEIEQWKQSLTYQSQELNRREMEMEARREQLEQMEGEFEQLEQQRQQFEQIRTEVEGQKEEFDRQKQELEGAWDHLRGELNRLEERKAELQNGPAIDPEKVQQISQLLGQVETSVTSVDAIQEQATFASEVLTQHQAGLQHHWSQLEQFRSQLATAQTEIDQAAGQLQQEWQNWREAADSLANAKAELKVQESTLHLKQDYAQALTLQLQHHEEVHQQLYRITEGLEGVDVGEQVDVRALEAMAIDALQNRVSDLEREYNKSSEFVMGQEEELELKLKEIAEIEVKISQVSDFDRMTLESELSDEQETYQFLNETLVGQRRSLREKQSLLRQHQSVLARRQGKADPHAKEGGLNLGPVFAQIDHFRQQRSEELQQVETQLEQIRASIEQTQRMLAQQGQEVDRQRQSLEQQDESLKARKLDLGAQQGKVALYEEMLQPFQDQVTDLKGRVEFMTASMSQIQSASTEQRQMIAQVHQALSSLIQEPALVA